MITTTQTRNGIGLFPFEVAEQSDPVIACATGAPEWLEVGSLDSGITNAEAENDDTLVSNAITNAKMFDLDDMIGMYLREIGAISLLTHAEEIELAKRMEKGRAAREKLSTYAERNKSITPSLMGKLRSAIESGSEAQSALISHNTRLVVSVARRYNNRGVDLEDLIQEGNIGLTRATSKFDYRRGFRFSTYATWWVRQSITRAIANYGRTIRIPVHANDLMIRLSNAIAELRQEGSNNPTLDQIAGKMKLAPNKVMEIVDLTSHFILSLDSPIKANEEDSAVLEDTISGDPDEVEVSIDRKLLGELFEQIFKNLDPLEYRVLKMRYGFNEEKAYTLDEIAEKLCIGREAVRYIEGKALKAFRQPAIRNRLSAFI